MTDSGDGWSRWRRRLQRRRRAEEPSDDQADVVDKLIDDLSDDSDGAWLLITADPTDGRESFDARQRGFAIPAERNPVDLTPEELARYQENLRRLQEKTRRLWDTAIRVTPPSQSQDAEPDYLDLTPAERDQLAQEAASLVSDTLARLFLRLGPPPEGTDRDFSPVTSGGGGATQ